MYTFEKIGKISGDQDGTIFGNEIFRMNGSGSCNVFDKNTFEKIGSFTLSKTDVFVPHSNAVCFGCTYFDKNDAYPLFYTNIYNNYAGQKDRRLGCTGVYRIEKKGGSYSGTLVQIIRIGFTEDDLWQSAERNDVRPYGNAVVDTDKNEYWAFTMRDGDRVTRFFRFAMPSLCDGIYDPVYGVKVVTLTKEDVLGRFDTPYSCYLQGADCHNGKIYSTEGIDFRDNPAKIRIINLAEQCEEEVIDLAAIGLPIEPEMIRVYDDCFIYSDNAGNLFRFTEAKQ